MAWPVQRTNNAEQEIAAANYPQVRIFKVPMKTADQPVDDVEAEWQPVTPESIKVFSAVAYFFARHLHDKLHKPIGIIQSAWGGTPAESWTSMEALKAEPALSFYIENWDGYLADYPAEKLRYERRLRDWEESSKTLTNGEAQRTKPQPPRGPGHQHAPATLYNAMIAPLTPYAIRGAIWYQGESNANIIQASRYRKLFETMIIDWRNHWGQGDFPFLFVQLANYANTGDQSGWPELRESQLKTLELKNAGMAVIIDIGESQDIHPRNKQDVGLRLGLSARAIAYGEKLVYSGPIYRQMTTENGKLRVWFDHVGGGLGIDGGDDLKGFTIAGADREFVPAKAEIDGETVVVSNPNVAEPLAVRYAWADDPVNNLINAEGLPASPFRTDQWRNARMAK